MDVLLIVTLLFKSLEIISEKIIHVNCLSNSVGSKIFMFKLLRLPLRMRGGGGSITLRSQQINALKQNSNLSRDILSTVVGGSPSVHSARTGHLHSWKHFCDGTCWGNSYFLRRATPGYPPTAEFLLPRFAGQRTFLSFAHLCEGGAGRATQDNRGSPSALPTSAERAPSDIAALG